MSIDRTSLLLFSMAVESGLVLPEHMSRKIRGRRETEGGGDTSMLSGFGTGP